MKFYAPSKVFLVKLDDPSVRVEAQFNPETLSRTVTPEYSKMTVLGQSHRPLQYTGTGNQVFSLDLYFDQLASNVPTASLSEDDRSALSRSGNAYFTSIRNWLEALCYPDDSEDGIIQAAPPDVLVVWPQNMSLICKVMGVTFEDELFFPTGEPKQFRVKVDFEESRSSRLTYTKVRRYGAQRGDDPGS